MNDTQTCSKHPQFKNFSIYFAQMIYEKRKLFLNLIFSNYYSPSMFINGLNRVKIAELI